jgi:hypothetical protein
MVSSCNDLKGYMMSQVHNIYVAYKVKENITFNYRINTCAVTLFCEASKEHAHRKEHEKLII